jgi:hypothetical protein
MAIFIIFLCGAYFFIRGMKKEGKDEKLLMLGFGSLFIGLGINRLFFFLADFFIEGDYVGHVFYGDYDVVNIGITLSTELGYLSFLISMAFFFITFEYVIKKSKFVLSILNILFIIVFFIVPGAYRRTAIYIFVFFDVFFLIMFLFWLSKISSVEFQAVSTLMMIGFILILIGNIADSSMIKGAGYVSSTTPVYFIIAGTLVTFSPMVINPKFLSKSIINWLIFAAFLGSMVGYGLIFLLTSQETNIISTFIWLAVIIGILLLIIVMMRIFKLLKPPEVLAKLKPEEEKKKRDILKMFIKPQSITEEEIMFHKEQKICLVCKSKVSRILFVCPSCDALYCTKCSSALSDLDNYCWVCEAALDETKPVKLPEKDVELKPLEPIKPKKDIKKSEE